MCVCGRGALGVYRGEAEKGWCIHCSATCGRYVHKDVCVCTHVYMCIMTLDSGLGPDVFNLNQLVIGNP